ncbi:MAG: hypothetical protein O0V67_04555, partial [Methanocorpusculum sp.]|nr:hypothetical protein [Methanocorpusculum sp.]
WCIFNVGRTQKKKRESRSLTLAPRIAFAFRGCSGAAGIREDSRSVYPHPATNRRLPDYRNPSSHQSVHN